MSEFKETPTVKSLLAKARALIASPSNWTKGRFARNSAGIDASLTGPNAYAFCTLGALRRVNFQELGSENGGMLGYNTRKALNDSLPSNHGTIVGFNDADATEHKDVLALFDRAIEKASQS